MFFLIREKWAVEIHFTISDQSSDLGHSDSLNENVHGISLLKQTSVEDFYFIWNNLSGV